MKKLRMVCQCGLVHMIVAETTQGIMKALDKSGWHDEYVDGEIHFWCPECWDVEVAAEEHFC